MRGALAATLMKNFFQIIFLLLLSGCKTTQPNLIGKYILTTDPKTELIINANNKFVFSKSNTISALLSNEDYIISQGTWELATDKTLILQSYPTEYLDWKIHEDSAKQKGISNFTFLNSLGDTLKISLYHYNNKLLGKVHGRDSHIETTIKKDDSLNFKFPGYIQYNFIKDNFRNSDYTITLFPKNNGSYFTQAKFLIKHKSLIEINRNSKFKKSGS